MAPTKSVRDLRTRAYYTGRAAGEDYRRRDWEPPAVNDRPFSLAAVLTNNPRPSVEEIAIVRDAWRKGVADVYAA